MAYDGSLKFDTKLNTKTFESDLAKMKSTAIKGFVAIGAVAAAGFGAAVKAGIDFESAFAGVKKTVDATDAQLASLSSGIREMAKEMPMSASAIAGIAESAGQLGIQTKNILSFTKTMADLGVATNLTGEEAASTLAKFANITGMAQENFDRLGSVIVALGNNLATTEADIAAMALRLAGAGKQVGLTEAQILSFSGALSSVGIESEAGGTAFSKLIADMQLAVETGSADLVNFANVAGMTTTDFQKAFKQDATGAIITFIKGLGQSEEKGLSAIKVLDDMGIKENRLRDALLRAAGASGVFANAIALGSKAWEENTALTNEAAQRYETLESKLGMAKNSAIDLGIAIYEGVQEPIRGAVSASTSNINKLTASVKSGELKGAIRSVGLLFSDLAKTIVNLTTSVLPILIKTLGFVGENLRTVTALVVAAVAATKTFAVILPIAKGIATFATTIKSAVVVLNAYTTATAASSNVSLLLASTLSKSQLLVGVLTGKISLATAAQTLWNAAIAANHIGLIIAGVAALAVGISALIVIMGRQKSEAQLLIEAEKERISKIKEQRQAYDELKASKEEQLNGDLALIANTQNLYAELKNLTDENGNVHEAYRSRVAFILGELNAALGTEHKMIDGTILEYGKLISTIDDLIVKKQMEAILSAEYGPYLEAVKKRSDAEREAAAKHFEIEEQKARVKEAEAKMEEARTNFGKLHAAKQVETEKEALKQKEDAYAQLSDMVDQYTNDYTRYQDLQKTALSGNVEDMKAAVHNYQNNLTTANDIALKSAEEQRQVLGSQYAYALQTLDEYLQKYGHLEDEEHKALLEEKKKYAEDCKREYDAIGGAIVDGTIQGIDGKRYLLQQTIDGLYASIPEWAKEQLGIKSPSRVMRDEVGKPIVEGIAVGIKENKGEVSKEFEKLLAELELQRNIDVINDAQYYAELEKLRDKYFAKGSADWWKYTQQIIAYEKSLVEQQKKDIIQLYTDIATEAGKRLDEVLALQDKMKGRLDSGFSSLHTNVRFTQGGETTEFMRLYDIQADLDALDEYERALTALKERGASQEFINALVDMTPEETAQFTNELLKHDDAAYNDYMSKWEERERRRADIPKRFYEKEASDLIDNFMKKAEEAGMTVPEGFFDIGASAAENFGEAFVKKMEEIAEKMRAAVSASMANIVPVISYAGGVPVLSGGQSYTQQNNFTIGTSKQTTAEQILSWQNAMDAEKLRGGGK